MKNLIMLPFYGKTKKNQLEYFSTYNTLQRYQGGSSIGVPQHLYELSDEQINEGDWVYRKGNGSFIKEMIYKVKKGAVDHIELIMPTYYNKKCKKIVSTTNERLRLPLLNDNDIEKFIDNHYNK